MLSLLFLARQTSELAKQTRLSNQIGTLTSTHDASDLVHDVQAIFTDKPELRSYFYDGKQCPRRGKRRAIVLNLAEMMTDAIDYGLMVASLIPDTKEYDGFRDYALFMMQSSPAVNDLVYDHPEWYLAYHEVIAEHALSLQAGTNKKLRATRGNLEAFRPFALANRPGGHPGGIGGGSTATPTESAARAAPRGRFEAHTRSSYRSVAARLAARRHRPDRL